MLEQLGGMSWKWELAGDVGFYRELRRLYGADHGVDLPTSASDAEQLYMLYNPEDGIMLCGSGKTQYMAIKPQSKPSLQNIIHP